MSPIRPAWLTAIGCRGTLLGGAAWLAVSVPAGAQQPLSPPELTQFLRQSVDFDAAQLAAVERGEPVVKVIATQNRRDVAVFGIITLPFSRDSYVSRVRDFRASLAAPTRVRFGIFSNPATAADVQTLTIDREDVDEARKCRPGDCKFKLPATEMRLIQEQLSGSQAEQHAQINAWARRRMVEYVTDYRARGDSALAVYDDRGGVSASDAFRALLAESPYVFQYVPALGRYLTAYPRAELPGSTDILYWAEDQPPHLRRTLTANHLVIYTPPEFPGMTVVASKQIYAKHFFEAGFELTSVIDRGGDGMAAGSYLVALRRYRFDNLPSGGLLNIRGRVIDSVRDKLLADLKRSRI